MNTALDRPAATYEDGYGPVLRRAARVWRRLKWTTKGLVGAPRDILLEVKWRLGDEVMALPIYAALKARYPKARLHVLCNHPDLLLHHPCVDSVNVVPPRVDRFILLRGASRTSPRIVEYATRARVPVPDARPLLMYTNWTSAQSWEVHSLGRPVVAFAADTTWPTKRWPLERWRELCRRVEAAGYATAELGQGDARIGAQLSFVGRTNVREAACTLRATCLLVSSDSGLMHLALACGTPVLALFGPTAPRILVRDNPLLSVLTNGRECAGCWNRLETPENPGACPRGIEQCLDPITVDDAYRAVLSRLSTE